MFNPSCNVYLEWQGKSDDIFAYSDQLSGTLQVWYTMNENDFECQRDPETNEIVYISGYTLPDLTSMYANASYGNITMNVPDCKGDLYLANQAGTGNHIWRVNLGKFDNLLLLNPPALQPYRV